MRKVLFILLGCILFLSGCGSAKKAVVSADDALVYRQAVAAVEESRFRIEGFEFYLPGKNQRVVSSGSYINVDKNNATVYFEPDVMPGSPIQNRKVENDNAVIVKVPGKNKELKYKLSIDNPQLWQRKEIFITLNKGSNECYVDVIHPLDGVNNISFKGIIYPLTD